MRGAFLVWLVACGGSPMPPAPAPSGPAPAAAPACVRAPDEAAPITRATGDDSRVQYCIGQRDDQCFTLDLATGKLAHLDKPPPAPAGDAGARIEATNPELKVCTGTDCKPLTPQVWPGAAPLHAATNGTIAVVLLGDAEAGKGYADVYDVAKAKKLTSFKYAHGDYRCGEVAMLGDSIYLATNVCAGPAGRATLYTTKGKKIAAVGGREFGTFGNANARVDGDTWAFLDENGSRLALQDVVKGKVAKSIEVGALWRTDPSQKDSFGNPGESAVVKLSAGKLAVIAGTPANGSVAVIDVASGKVEVVRAPLCK